jgi:tRNA(Ile)-lysidine synthase
MLQWLRAFCTQYGIDKTYWIAYSGGLDSAVLLSLFHELGKELPLKLRAIHVNHGVSPHAGDWSNHCAQVCEQYGIDLLPHTLASYALSSGSLEADLRDARYGFFATCLAEGDVLVTAHHQDDQAETILLQLLRGAGPKGLAAMAIVKPFAAGYHGRPLLDFTRDSLQRYADDRQLVWIEDESNQNPKFTRNYLRHEILPLLKARWPSVSATLSRSATYCAEAQTLLEEFAHEIHANVAGSCKNTLSVSKLLQCSPERQRLILRCWIHQAGFSMPDAKKLETIQTNVLTAGWDRLPCVSWGLIELRRYRDDLYLMTSLAEQDLSVAHDWELTIPLHVPGIGVMHAVAGYGRGMRADLKSVSIRFRQGGENVEIPGRGRRTLKNLFQEWNVLPWERERVPLIYAEDKLIAVTGYFLHADYAAKSHELGYEIHCQF